MIKKFKTIPILILFGLSLAVLGSPQPAGKHIVSKGDTWYSLSKRYKISYADLRSENRDHSDKLQIGDTLLIPLPADDKHDPWKKETPVAAAVPEKKYHTVKAGETMTLIAKKYGCRVNDLMEWNKRTSKNLKPGEKLVVGTIVTAAKPPQAAADTVSSHGKKDSVPVVMALPADTPVASHPKRDSLPPNLSHSAEQKMAEEKMEQSFAKNRKEISEEGAVVWIEDQEINPGKYFALHRTAPIGTIVKVTNRMNRRVVFVKVVGKLPETGDNENIVLKISKAAAEKLGVIDPRFQAQLNYGVEGP